MSISVIIPAWRAEKTLRLAVESVLATEVADIKIIICVDPSGDRTGDVAESIRSAYPDIITVLTHVDGKNHGAGATRNLGLLGSKTEYISFLDVDDLYLENRFDQCLAYLDAHKDLDFVYETTQIMGADDSSIWGDDGLIHGPDGSRDAILRSLASGRCWHFNALTLRRSALNKADLINENLRLGQDIEWFIRLASSCPFKSLSKETPVATYRRYSGNRSSFDRGRNMPNVMGKAYGWLVKHHYYKEAELISTGFLGWLLSFCSNVSQRNETFFLRLEVWFRSLIFYTPLVGKKDFWRALYSTVRKGVR